MDAFEARKVVFDRITKLEPENIALEIVSHIYFQNLPGEDMIRLALGPDAPIQTLILKTKNRICMDSNPVVSPPISPTMNPSPLADPSLQFNCYSPPSPCNFPPPGTFRTLAPRFDPRLVADRYVPGFKFSPWSDDELASRYRYMGMEEQPEPVRLRLPKHYYGTEAAFNSLGIRGSRNAPNLVDYPVKTCHYFSKGRCKHGESCRYVHVGSPDNYPHMFNTHNQYDGSGDDQMLSPGSLEKLELEITELLKSRRGSPVSIAALPMMYCDKYGRTLQAEGYLTESQRHGKAGYSLTKLLARLKNSIRLIDRPHGQHAVILAEDAHKYMEIRGERNDPGPVVHGSRQIYLTFPCESTFTEDDVSKYFSSFGEVEDVRMPCQQKRMFGFVSFKSSDTVKLILSKVNPHYVCGARVLVKPYREKSKLIERKNHDKFDNPTFYHSQMESDFHSGMESIHLEKKLIDELERMRLSQVQLARQPFTSLGYSMNELQGTEDHSKFPSAEQLNYYLRDALNHGSTSDDDNRKHSTNSCGDQDSTQGVNLPDSPFAGAASSISAVI